MTCSRAYFVHANRSVHSPIPFRASLMSIVKGHANTVKPPYNELQYNKILDTAKYLAFYNMVSIEHHVFLTLHNEAFLSVISI